ncbi:aminopeptidase [Solimonas soli]|uniref:aminopeptidase n=1 Tax=Solimonas soli TaxID=413479 RepID=UPI0004AD0B9F|nr:aminopeptidase [Solimonas soli]
MRRLTVVILTLCAAFALSACGTLGYYAQAVSGQIQLLRARQPIAEVIADPATDAKLRERLRMVQAARDWAVQALALPDNGSYRSYVALSRPYVAWNVFATPEFSLEPLEHCFPVAGCVGYQGWYAEADARAQAERLEARGYEVYVGGVPAYSTLGWFDDPLLSSMLRWDDATLLATLFHELAHQKLYIKHDTRFNESFAEFVGEQGLREYLAQHPQARDVDIAARRRQREQFTALVLALRERLAALYREPLAADLMRARKQQAFADFEQQYAALRDGEWHGVDAYGGFFRAGPLNNARLLPFGLYDADLPAFATLYAENAGDWPRFYAAVAALSRLDGKARRAALDRLAGGAGRPAPAPPHQDVAGMRRDIGAGRGRVPRAGINSRAGRGRMTADVDSTNLARGAVRTGNGA